MSSTRLLPLDVLRALAVLFVIVRHVPFDSSAHPVLQAWHRGGWVGVDMFFVLSGFLVSGLLFREYLSSGTISITRFLVRRGLKIYPAFYFFLFVTVALKSIQHPIPFDRGLLGEILFLQNYLSGIWNHTWSLAVEEHFYLGIVLLVTVLLQRGAKFPLQPLPWILALLAPTLLTFRLLNLSSGWLGNLLPTHVRIDSLGFGVLLSYLYHFRNFQTASFFKKHRLLALIAGLLLLPAFLWPLETTPAIYTVGLTGIYIGSGMILMLFLTGPFPHNTITKSVGQIGVYSYSIYLWHMPVIRGVLRATPSFGVVHPFWQLLLSIVWSSILGVAMAKCSIS